MTDVVKEKFMCFRFREKETTACLEEFGKTTGKRGFEKERKEKQFTR